MTHATTQAGDNSGEAGGASPMHSLSPHLVIDGAAEAIAFYKQAFGAEEVMRLPAPNGRLMHACILVNGSSVMLMDEHVMEADEGCGVFSPRTLKGTPVSLHLIVPDVDAAIARAVEAGASLVMPAEDMFWGDRYGVIEDPFGHRWSLATPRRQVSEAELKEAVQAMMKA